MGLERRRPRAFSELPFGSPPSISQVSMQRVHPLPYPFGFCCDFLIVKNSVFGLLILGVCLSAGVRGLLQPCPPASRLPCPLRQVLSPPPPFRLIFVEIF